MSKFLAIDTSSKYLSVLAVNESRYSLIYDEDCAMLHSQKLMDGVDEALYNTDLKIKECDFFAAVTGPGSFTGIRIGISAVKGFSFASGKPLLGIPAFDLTGLGLLDEAYACVIDAGKGCYYIQGYNKAKDITPRFLSEKDIISLHLPLYGWEDLSLPKYTKKKQNLLLAVQKNEGKISSDIKALYIRKSQAEEGRK